MKLISELIKLILAGAFFLCLLDMPYGFYELIRFSAFAGFGYLAILEFQKRNTNGLIIYVVLALLFQPFVKVALERELWNIIDVSVAIGLIINTVYTFYKNPRNKSMSIKNIDKRILAREFLFTLGYLISISLIYVIVIFADNNNESQLRKLRKKVISLELPSESFINDAYNLAYSRRIHPRRTFEEFRTEASYNSQLVSKLYREYQKSHHKSNVWREFSLSREKFDILIGYRFLESRLSEAEDLEFEVEFEFNKKSKEVFEYFYKEMVNTGYRGSKDEYKVLLQTTPTLLKLYGTVAEQMGAVIPVKKTEPPVTNVISKEEETKLKKLDAEILLRVERAGDPYRNYLWDLSVGILAIVFGMRYLIYATLWSLKQIRK